MKNYTINEVIFYFAIPNLNLLQSNDTFFLEDLIPPIVWKNQSLCHQTLGSVFFKIIDKHNLQVERLTETGITKYRKL